MTKNKEEVIKEVTENGLLLKDAPDSFKKDKEVITAALNQNGLAL